MALPWACPRSCVREHARAYACDQMHALYDVLCVRAVHMLRSAVSRSAVFSSYFVHCSALFLARLFVICHVCYSVRT
eukprot:4313248-Alexandrium_andersonii.AAC.1